MRFNGSSLFHIILHKGYYKDGIFACSVTLEVGADSLYRNASKYQACCITPLKMRRSNVGAEALNYI